MRRVIRRLTPFIFAFAAVLLRAQPSQPEITAEHSELVGERVILTGHAQLRDVGLLMTADAIQYDRVTDTATATGHVIYTRGPLRLLAEKVVVHRPDRTFSAEHIRLGSYPYYIEGATAHGTRDEITVQHARVSYGEPGPWQPTATADVLTLSADGKRIRTEGALVGLGHAQPLPFPKFQENLSEPLLSFVSLTGGYRGSLGAFLDAGLHLPVAPGVRLGGDVGYYTARGLLVGPSGSYSDTHDPDRLRGFFRTGYINDHGDKKTDVLGRPVPENRGFVQWEHQQLLTDQLSLTAQLNWWKDSEVLRDFRPRQFFPVQQPDTTVEATYANPNSFVSVFARYNPNSFEIVQQRLPEIRFDMLPIALPGGFVERFSASFAVLREQPLPSLWTSVWQPVEPVTNVTPVPSPPGTITIPATASVSPLTAATASVAGTPSSWTVGSPLPAGSPTELRSTRLDGYYGLMRPIAPNDWFALTPVVGGRITHYSDTYGAAKDGSYTRTLGEIGADVELRSSGIFAYKNEAWHIDGLRHLFTPRVSYRYIPEGASGQKHIPAIDRETFSTYLQPLGLGDARNIDQLHATNTLRLELANTLQTRDDKYGSRDLLTFNVANDFRFKRAPGERDVSEIHTEIGAAPTRWLQFGTYNSFSPQTFTLREFNSGVTLHDGQAWSLRFANNFLRHQLQDYYIDGRVRINEAYEAVTQVRYDQRKHRFTEQSYGVVQNLANTWRISYLVSFYSGRQRESGFGFSIQVDTVRF
jgi:LPS-assembly protein